MFKQSLLLIVVLLSSAAAAVAEKSYEIGLAKVDITPDEPLWLSGYGFRNKPAEGKVHELCAKAVAFRDAAGTRLVLVTLDLGSVNPSSTDYVAKKVEQKFGLPRAALVLNCSHTHCAPEICAERRLICHYPDEQETKLVKYLEELNDKLVDLVGLALADLRPAELSVSRSNAGFAHNRRGPGGINPNGPVDHDVPVLRISGSDGQLRGLLFGYACHNTTLNFQKYCGDYAGFAQYDLEADHPGAIAMFVMGCGGDQNPQPRHGPMGLEHAKNHGRALADAVNKALGDEQKPVDGSLRMAYEVVTLDLEPLPSIERLRSDAAKPVTEIPSRKAQYLLSLIDAAKQVPLTQECPLHAANFGDDLLMIFVSGETLVDYSLRCKSEFAGPFVWVAGYCDDVFAYLPSRRVLLEGGYEGRTNVQHQLLAAPFQPSVEDRVMQSIHKLVKQVSDE